MHLLQSLGEPRSLSDFSTLLCRSVDLRRRDLLALGHPEIPVKLAGSLDGSGYPILGHLSPPVPVYPPSKEAETDEKAGLKGSRRLNPNQSAIEKREPQQSSERSNCQDTDCLISIS